MAVTGLTAEIIDTKRKYLEETREYIEKLKNDLIRKILIQQKPMEIRRHLTDFNSNDELFVTREI